MERYSVIDVETTVKNKGPNAIGDFHANPHDPKNKIICMGAKHDSSKEALVLFSIIPPSFMNEIIVGHNIKFDLLSLYKESDSWYSWRKSGRIWDTMVVEYLLTGHQTKYASLDELSIKYGGTLKPDKIAQYWEAGIETEDIPKDELEEYQASDVYNTEIIFLGQYEEATRLGMLPLIHSQMDAIMAATEIEYNGMYCNMQVMHDNYIKARDLYNNYEAKLLSKLAASGIEEPMPSSNEHISFLLFGGEQSVVRDVPNPLPSGEQFYKTGVKKGMLRTKKAKVNIPIKGIIPVTLAEKTSKEGIYQTGDAILKNLKKIAPAHTDLLNLVINYREAEKDFNTYYKGYFELIWPHDTCIHGTLNHCSTDTGRMSSTKPNLQNVSGD